MNKIIRTAALILTILLALVTLILIFSGFPGIVMSFPPAFLFIYYFILFRILKKGRQGNTISPLWRNVNLLIYILFFIPIVWGIADYENLLDFLIPQMNLDMR